VSASDEVKFRIYDELPSEAAAVVDAGLDAANHLAAPLDQVRRLAVFAQSPSGQVVGGAIGRTWGSCCELQQLWVQEDLRRQGVGTQLVRQFEQRAIERGCRTIYLETYSFQSPLFYQSLGYHIALELPGHAADISKYIMIRLVENNTWQTSFGHE
jgi:ribosomal protein S18 acetylase RimI-like enzyme